MAHTHTLPQLSIRKKKKDKGKEKALESPHKTVASPYKHHPKNADNATRPKVTLTLITTTLKPLQRAPRQCRGLSYKRDIKEIKLCPPSPFSIVLRREKGLKRGDAVLPEVRGRKESSSFCINE